MTRSPFDRPLTAGARGIVRASAAYDLIVTALFAFPFTVHAVFDVLQGLHGELGLPGSVPSADVFTVLFANLMGSVVLVWSIVRLIRPTLLLGAADVAARALFSLGMVAAMLHGASPVVGAMLALELVWALVQAVALIRSVRSIRPAQPSDSVPSAATII
jgi:hypothetical protein